MNSLYSKAVETDEAAGGFDLPSRVGQLVGQHVYKPLGGVERVRSEATEVRSLSLDAECKQVATALRNPNWDFRTLDGIARETGLSRATVKRLLTEHDISRRPFGRPDAELFTARDRPVSWRERLSLWSAFVAKQTQ